MTSALLSQEERRALKHVRCYGENGYTCNIWMLTEMTKALLRLSKQGLLSQERIGNEVSITHCFRLTAEGHSALMEGASR